MYIENVIEIHTYQDGLSVTFDRSGGNDKEAIYSVRKNYDLNYGRLMSQEIYNFLMNDELPKNLNPAVDKR